MGLVKRRSRPRIRGDQPLWTCPRCGVKLLTQNLSHSCNRATLHDWHVRLGPHARALYDRFERLIANCGAYDVSPAKTRITFLAHVRFAGITRISETAMTCNAANHDTTTGAKGPRLIS